jgi:hypothetical protein
MEGFGGERSDQQSVVRGGGWSLICAIVGGVVPEGFRAVCGAKDFVVVDTHGGHAGLECLSRLGVWE